MTHFNLNRMLQGCSAFIQTMAGDRAARNDAKRVNNHVLPLTCPLLASSLRLTCPLQLRRVALILCVLVLSVGELWATDVYVWDGNTSETKLSKTSYTNDTDHEDGTTGFVFRLAGWKDALVDITGYTNYSTYGKSKGILQGGTTASSNNVKLVIPEGYTASVYVVYALTGNKPKYFGLNATTAVQPNGSNCSAWNVTVNSNTTLQDATINALTAGTYYLLGSAGNCVFAEIKVTLTASSARTYDGTEKMYFLRDAWSWWKNDGVKFFAYFWNSSTDEHAWSEAASWAVQTTSGNKDVWAYTVPAGTWTHVQITRHPSGTTTPTMGNRTNWSNDITLEATTNLLTNWTVMDQDNTGHSITWSNITLDGKKVYFDNRNYPDWTSAYVRIGHSSSNSAWGPMTLVAGTRNLYEYETDQWDYHTNFSVANSYGWTGSNNIYQPWEGQDWSAPAKITKQTTYQKYGIARDVYLCPTSTSMLERECQYYNVNGGTSTNTFEDVSTGVSLPSYTVTSSASHCTVTLQKCTNYESGTYTDLSSGGTVLPTQYVKVTVTPDANYQFGSVEVTGAGTVTAAAAGTPGVYYITGDATITATCTCVALTVNRGGTAATPAGGVTVGTPYGTLTCSASTGVIASYQWKQNTTASTVGAVNAEGSGATTASFSPNPASAGSYYYYCVATDACGNSVNTSYSGLFTFNAATYTLTVSGASVANPMTEESTTGAISGVTITGSPVSGITSGTTTSTSDNTFTVNKGTPVTVTASATVAGSSAECDECTYRFKEWTNVPASVTANVSNIQAVYNTTYTIAFRETDGTTIAGVSDTYYVYGTGKTVATFPTPTKSGYEFSGWYKENTLTNAATDLSSSDYGNITYYAKWVIDDGCHKYFYYNTLSAPSPAPTKNEDSFFSSVPTGSSSSTASWEIDGVTYTTSNRCGNSSNIGTFTVPAGKVATMYVMFNGGSSYTMTIKKGGSNYKTGIDASSGIKKYTEEDMGAGTYAVTTSGNVGLLLLIVKVCDPVTYTVTYKHGDGGATGDDVVVNPATTIGGKPVGFTAPTGKTFVRWNTAANGSGTNYYEGDPVTSDLTLHAQWGYVLTYDANAGGDAVSNLPDPEPHMPEVTTLSSTVPTRSGYTFSCWNRNTAGTGDCFSAGGAFTMGAENQTLYAKWTEDECTPTTLFSMVVNPSAADYKLSASTEMTSELTSRLTSYSGGTPSIYNTTTSSNKDVIKNNTVYLGSNDVYLKVVLSGGNTLQAGDVITITTRTAYQPYITKTTTRTTTPTMTKTGSSDPYTYSITLANTNSATGKDIIGGGTLYFWKGGSAVEIRSITITRPCDESAATCKTPNITNIASTTNMTTAETKPLNVTVSNADALTGTVSYAWTNADGSAIAAAANASGANTARLTLTKPTAGTYTFKCTVTNDCGGDGSQSANSAIFTVVVTESTGCTEIAKVIVSGKDSGTGSGTKIADPGGYGVNLEDTPTTHDGNTGYKIGSSKYVYLQLASGEQFQNGDKVKVYITNLSDQGDNKLHIFQGTTAAGTEVATVNSPVLGWNETTLSGVTSGQRSLTIHRSSGTTEQNHGIYAFAVERCVDCTPATHKGLAYTKTSYTVNETASALTVTNPENVDTYQWKWNTTGDRTSGSNCGTNSASFTPPTTAEAEGTRYYWCELTNDCGTVKTSAVGITVSAVLSDVTVTWTDPAGTVNYGGGGYTIKATVDPAEWDGTLTASMLAAPDGIRIYDVEINNTEHTLQAKFDVQTTFDREANATAIPFALTLDATTNYESKISEHNVTYAACAGGGGGSNVYVIGYSNSDATNISSSANFRAYETASNWYTAGNTTFTDKTSTDGFTISATEKSYYWQNNGTFTTSSSSNCRLKTIKMGNGNNPTIRWTNESLAFSKVRIIGRNTSDKEATTLTVSNDGGTTTKTFTFAAGSSAVQTKEVEMDFVSGNTKGIVVSGGEKEINVLVELIPAGAGGTLPTALTWSNSQESGATLEKDEGTADFAVTAVRDAAATTSLGALTYSSSDPSVATVNETTGQVHIADNIDFGGATYKETTITATLAASGCYMRAEITYVLHVNKRACEDVAGTVTSNTVGCTTTLTLSDYTAGATIQWYKDGVSLGSADGAQTATYVATSAGDYYAVTHKTCDRTSNTVTVTSTAVSATKIVDEWYVKNGRRTPDIALVQTENATGFTVTTGSPASDITSTGIGGCGFYLGTDGIIYLKGAQNDGSDPSDMTEGDDVLSITATGCSAAAPVSVTIHRQVETDKYVLAYVVTGKQDGGWTQDPPSNQTTGVELYRTLTNHFDVQATNIYASIDEQKIKEYYSRYDIIFITDYPNTKKTKGETGKSYVNALGAMIDIRPILTMEAWVSGLSNWSAKGVAGNPKSPTTRQYNMLLQCKDHEIFSGTTVETIGEGDDVKFKINMVDSTKALYDTLDTKYGAGTHEEKKGYCYGKHPALQGFIYDETLADMLPLGLIDDGEGNNLQVGLERQKEMEARMMVLGINADAMERLSDDGETVIVNALKYLMKKDAEDISDCSIYFDNAGGDHLWSTVANWGPSHLTLPQPTQEARILQPCIVDGAVAKAASVKIVTDGTYNHGSSTANGSLTIRPTGKLSVGGRIVAASAPNYYEVRPTDAAKLVIEANNLHTGALIHGHKSGELNATVQLVSKAYSERVEDGGKIKTKKYWQYVGLPVQEALAEDAFYGGYTYKYNEPSGWEKKRTGDMLEEFWGIGLSYDNYVLGKSSPITFTISGALALATDRDIELTKTSEAGNGENMIGNSWTAPIHLVNMTAEDFENATATIYLFNTGRNDSHTNSDNGSTTPGQWVSVPVAASKQEPWVGPKVIPAMQAFEVDVKDGESSGTLHLNYDKHVRAIATIDEENEPLRAPKRYMDDEPMMLRLRVADSATYTDLYLIEGEQLSDEFDNGWDGKYQQCDGRSATLYALSPIGNMAVLAQQSINNTAIVFRPGRQNEYTFTFGYNGEVAYYLNDLLLEQSTEIREGNEYRFTCNEGDMESRFVVSTTPFGAPDITTGIGNAGHPEKVQKIMYKDHIYIIRAGRVYDIVGKEVR